MFQKLGPIYILPCSLNDFLKWVISPHPPPPAQDHEHKKHLYWVPNNYRYRQTNTRRSVCYRKSLMEDRHFSNELVTSVQGGEGVTRINPQYVPSRRISKRRCPGMRGLGISTCCSWSHVSCQGEQYRAD